MAIRWSVKTANKGYRKDDSYIYVSCAFGAKKCRSVLTLSIPTYRVREFTKTNYMAVGFDSTTKKLYTKEALSGKGYKLSSGNRNRTYCKIPALKIFDDISEAVECEGKYESKKYNPCMQELIRVED